MAKTLNHGMILDAKRVMDNALPELAKLRELIPIVLHPRLDKILAGFEDTLCACDVSKDFQERTT